MKDHYGQADINRIYRDHVLVNDNPEYLNRYDDADLSEENLGRINFPRIIAIFEFARLIKKYSIRSKNLLMFNGGATGDPELRHIETERVLRLDYDEATEENDLHLLDLKEKDFDFFLFAQTLEHLYDPLRCIRRINAHLATGGHVFTSVPVANISHNAPFHFYSGFTQVGLGLLFERAGFEILEIGQWGNVKYLYRVFESEEWAVERKLRKGYHDAVDRRFPYEWFRDGRKNQFHRPVDAWILARKIADSGVRP